MAKGLFVTGFTLQDVLDIQNKAKALLKEGKTLMSYTEGGTTSSKQFTMPIADVLDECGYALQQLAPETYGKRRKYLTSNYRMLRDL